MESYKVYKITCLCNGKLYIGYTKHDINNRLKTHFRNSKKTSMNNNKFGNAILKYGKDNFIIELLFECDNKNIALEKEKENIKKYNSLNLGYNSTNGGEIGTQNMKHADFSGEKNPMYGKKHSVDIRKKIGDRDYKHGENHHFYKSPVKTSFKSGKDHPNSIPIIINDIKYDSINEAVNKLKIHRRIIMKMGTLA